MMTTGECEWWQRFLMRWGGVIGETIHDALPLLNKDWLMVAAAAADWIALVESEEHPDFQDVFDDGMVFLSQLLALWCDYNRITVDPSPILEYQQTVCGGSKPLFESQEAHEQEAATWRGKAVTRQRSRE